MAPTRARTLALLALAGGLAAACADSPVPRESLAGAPFSLWLAGTNVGSYVVFQRSVFDAVYSFVTGKDCSLVNLERRGEYCRSVAVASPEPFCVRTIGEVDCWTVANPYGPQRPVTDTPARPASREALRWSLSPFRPSPPTQGEAGGSASSSGGQE